MAVSPSAFVIPNVIVTVGSAVDSTGTAAAAAVGAGKEKTISPDKLQKYNKKEYVIKIRQCGKI